MEQYKQITRFSGLVDLASERLGGTALIASDDFFAPKENLLKPGQPVFIPDKYTNRGKWMDGWESRRKRNIGPGNDHDWCVIKLGCSGVIEGVDIDTSFFLGNNPTHAFIEACTVPKSSSSQNMLSKTIRWKEILPKSETKPGSHNFFTIRNSQQWTHLRLNIFPDGGVARLRVYGRVIPEWNKKHSLVDLAAIENGGVALTCSNMFFSPMNNLIMPGRSKNMSDGWETKRRRGPGYDWIIIKFGHAGRVKKIEIDTNYFKGNYPDSCSVEGCSAPDKHISSRSITWKKLLPNTKLQAHKRHFFSKELKNIGAITHVRLNIFPDGGVSRLRVYGTLE